MDARRLKIDAGVVLVEALASLAIAAMIALMLATGLTTGRRVWERVDRRQADGETVESVQAALRDRLEGVYPQTMNDSSPPYIDFQGEPGQVTFISNPSLAARPAPLRRYTLLLDPKGRLILNSVSDTAQSGAGVVDTRVLLTGVREIELSYFGAVFPDLQPRWRRVWHDEGMLPQVVRARVAFAAGDPRDWPDLMVRPRATVDSLCAINPATHRCKGRA